MWCRHLKHMTAKLHLSKLPWSYFWFYKHWITRSSLNSYTIPFIIFFTYAMPLIWKWFFFYSSQKIPLLLSQVILLWRFPCNVVYLFKDCREFVSSCVTLNAKSQTHHWEDKHIPPFMQMCIILIQLNTRYIKNQTHLCTTPFFLWSSLPVDGTIFLSLPYGPDSLCLRTDLLMVLPRISLQHRSCLPPLPFPLGMANGMVQAFIASYPDHCSGFKNLVPFLFNKFHPCIQTVIYSLTLWLPT